MSGISRKSRMFNYLNSEISAQMTNGRTITGIFTAYDKHMNIVLADAVEKRLVYVKNQKEREVATRDLGLVILRGANIVAVTVNGNLGKAPPSRDSLKATARLPGQGCGVAAGRAMPMQKGGKGRAKGGPPASRGPGVTVVPPGFPGGMPPGGIAPPPGFPGSQVPYTGMTSLQPPSHSPAGVAGLSPPPGFPGATGTP
eukprot:TRINITY_DN12711_c0_g1_i1.p1 TRINITY_DN12711_c0_g1~~TRINITY_DN12711_c0_g1_i1.p1  ORF type:complete len:199 (+),score=29.93 TRINITY_DN12711_c0_g1_i1:115-711(+)